MRIKWHKDLIGQQRGNVTAHEWSVRVRGKRRGKQMPDSNDESFLKCEPGWKRHRRTRWRPA